MDWKSFTVEMTKALAWPLVFTAVLCLFYRQIGLVLTVALRSLRRIRTFKYGGVELALGVVEAAAAETERTTEAVTRRIASEDLTPGEKQQLLNQLKEAAAETERFRGILAAAGMEPERSSMKRYRAPTSPPEDAREALSRLARAVTPRRVEAFAREPDLEDLKLEVGRFVSGKRTNLTRPLLFDQKTVDMLTEHGFLDSAGNVTQQGAMELVKTSRIISLNRDRHFESA